MKKSKLEKRFAQVWELYRRQSVKGGPFPAPDPEYRFAPPRKWRFDFAWPEHRVAVEIEGGLWKDGRHIQPLGFLADLEKYEAALLNGWIVYRVPGDWIDGGKRDRIAEVCDTVAHLLVQTTPPLRPYPVERPGIDDEVA